MLQKNAAKEGNGRGGRIIVPMATIDIEHECMHAWSDSTVHYLLNVCTWCGEDVHSALHQQYLEYSYQAKPVAQTLESPKS